MNTIALTPPVLDNLVGVLQRASILRGLDPAILRQVAGQATLLQASAGESLTSQGTPAEFFFVVLEGRAGAFVRCEGAAATATAAGAGTGDAGESQIATLVPGDSFGDAAMLAGEPFGASVRAQGTLVAARFPASLFDALAAQVPAFGLALARSLAVRLVHALRSASLPEHPEDAPVPPAETLQLLPDELLRRHRVLPLSLESDLLTLGVVDPPEPALIETIRGLVPGVAVRPVRIRPAMLQAALDGLAGGTDSGTAPGTAASGDEKPLDLIELLVDMVAQGASDLHLSARQRPKWRIDGRISQVPGLAPLEAETVFDSLIPLVDERFGRVYRETNDADFSYRHPKGERFRVNMFRDTNGTGAVLRHVPSRIPSLEQLGMPEIVRRLCSEPKGLVLVTGPTGSGKSTTLAAMVDLINATRDEHVLTLEDPVEFVHAGKRSHVNQREVGSHTRSFAQALRAALREDPDVVLVGEMRDLETVSLALETANTGHLVLATLHTTTAALTVARIVGMFPAGEQEQIRTTLADVLRAVICQVLCRRVGGGRVAALEVMVVNAAISNLIREGKMSQVPSMMQAGKALGNVLLNESLATLVKSSAISADEAMSKAVDKVELGKRLEKGSGVF